METEQSIYAGYVCDECGRPFEMKRPVYAMNLHCPDCGHMFSAKEPSTQIAVVDTNIQQGFYECFDCGHLFGYSATELENSESLPNCTECGSENTDLIV